MTVRYWCTYQDALHIGIDHHPDWRVWTTTRIAQKLDAFIAGGEIETDYLIGPALGVPLYSSVKVYSMADVEHCFSRVPAKRPRAPAVPARKSARATIRDACRKLEKTPKDYPNFAHFLIALCAMAGVEPGTRGYREDNVRVH